MGHRGVVIDALVSVRFVTADGNIVTTSKQENPDLFWGIRGAGSNFGIVVSATFIVWDITNNGQAMSAGLVFPASVNGNYWRALQTFDNNMPPQLSLTSMAFFDRQTNQVRVIR
jgi:FAD/FMN-containing dehydrogenase